MERDTNGARGIFLRALGDTPALHDVAISQCQQGRIGNCANRIVSVS